MGSDGTDTVKDEESTNTNMELEHSILVTL